MSRSFSYLFHWGMAYWLTVVEAACHLLFLGGKPLGNHHRSLTI
ncbi:MAG: hypothetical protein PUD22_07070 [Erysipelotrichaceae bacterium]|nr:hypothetical protein [Erysipelotrichaceae bacterium]